MNKILFYDVDTQNDFMNPDGALYVPKAETIKPNLKLLTDYAIINNIKIMGSMDTHFGTPEYKDKETELKKWGGPFPDHCIYNTKGQQKIIETEISNDEHTLLVPSNFNDEIINFDIDNYKRILFEKQSYDVFYSETNPGGNMGIATIINNFFKNIEINKKTVVVYGVATDYCVMAAVLGFLNRNINVVVVLDAIMGVNVRPGDVKNAIDIMESAGAFFLNTKHIIDGTLNWEL